MLKVEKRAAVTGRTAVIRSTVAMLVAIFLAFLVAGLLIVAIGVNPLEAYSALIKGAFGSTYRLSETLLRMTPLLMISLGVAIGYRTGMFNMGGEGQFIIGMIAGTVVYLYVPAGPVLTTILAMIAAMAAGALYCGFPGAMKAKFGVSESIINIMLNYVATLWLSRLLNSVLKDPNGTLPQSAMINESYAIPILIENTRLHWGFIGAVLLAVVAYIVLFYTPLGYQFRATGSNINAARYAGYNVVKLQILAMAISGALAGLAGCVEIGAVQHRLMEGISANYGWDAIPVALIGKQNPLLILLSSLLFAALKVGSNSMQTTCGVPNNLSSVLQGIVVLFALGSNFFVRYRIRYVKRSGALGKERAANG